MVADNKKQLPVNDAVTVSQPHMSDGSEARGADKLSFSPKNKKKTIAYALIVIAILVGGLLVLKHEFHIGEKVYAQAAGHKIYKEDVQNLIGNTKGVSERQAATVLADKYLTRAMAKDAGITVSDQDLLSQYGPAINKQKTSNPYVYQNNVNNTYFNKLLAYNAGLYKGKLLVANFSRYIAVPSPFLAFHQAEVPAIGNPAAIAADKKYAYDFINSLYSQIKSGKITFDEAIQKEHSDPQIGLKAYQTLPHSGPFDTSNVYLGGTTLIAPQSIQPKISSMKAGQLSAPFPVTVGNTFAGQKTTFESYYLVVRMDSTAGSHSGLSYDQYLSKSKQQLGYKIYV